MHALTVLTSSLALAALALPAQASIITSVSNGAYVSAMNSGAGVTTPNPGNDNVLGLATNTMFTNVSYTTNAGWGGTIFSLTGGPATEYTATFTVTNNTGQAWNRYDFYIGTGNITTNPPGGFTWIVFDYDLSPTITGPGTGGAVLTMTNNNLFYFSNLNVASGQTFTAVFNIDLPLPGVFGQWAVQQLPYPVPAPGAAALAGLLGLAVKRRRRA